MYEIGAFARDGSLQTAENYEVTRPFPNNHSRAVRNVSWWYVLSAIIATAYSGKGSLLRTTGSRST